MKGIYGYGRKGSCEKLRKRLVCGQAFLAVTLIAAAPALHAESFFFKHTPGDTYRILSTVHESVYVNRQLSHQATILNRIAVTVGQEDAGVSRHEAVFQTAEQATRVSGRQSFQWAREYYSEFGRDRLGRLTIDRKYYMPVVRNVPVFPERDLRVGESWTAEGHEMHDFRDSFGIEEPYRIPFTARYTFLGEREWKKKPYPAIKVSYQISTEPRAVAGNLWPTKITGSSDQVVYWDKELGQPVAYEETFQIQFNLSNGMIVEYQGKADAELIESVKMDKEEIVKEISGDLERMGIEDTYVRAADDGITISIENIQFEADSSTLLPEEQAKLDKIGAILRRYSERDILVGGHTALAGTEAGRQQLSLERASAVAEYLIEEGVRAAERIVVRGYGAEAPLGDNNTEAGRRKNRRVEITILEN
ncbi:MAG: OmpA family protein [Treponema sp.]|jgi:outer membrane protein OmpA-like peptidoglycan-associated protein|nr:OmpA family protein [Treponema sp.]